MSNITFVSNYWQGFNTLTAFENNIRHSCCGYLNIFNIIFHIILRNLFDSIFWNHEEDSNKISKSSKEINYQMQIFDKMYEKSISKNNPIKNIWRKFQNQKISILHVRRIWYETYLILKLYIIFIIYNYNTLIIHISLIILCIHYSHLNYTIAICYSH